MTKKTEQSEINNFLKTEIFREKKSIALPWNNVFPFYGEARMTTDVQLLLLSNIRMQSH